MTRADLKCFVCCCGAFLPKVKENESGGDIEKGDTQDQEKDYYSLLGLESNKATTEQIRRAYKKKSLEFHPDKILQRQKKGVSFNTDDEEKMRRDFQRIKEAYEILMDTKKREVYDIIGKEAMQYYMNPSSIEIQTVLGNLAVADSCSRTKVVLCLFLLMCAIMTPPILICLKVDYHDSSFEDITWVLVLIPAWIFDVLLFSWIIRKTQFSLRLNRNKKSSYDDPSTNTAFPHESSLFFISLPLLQVTVFIVQQIMLALKLDGILDISFSLTLIPIYIFEFLRLISSIIIIRSVESAKDKMCTISYVENELKRPYADLTPEERDSINKEYLIVHSSNPSPDMNNFNSFPQGEINEEFNEFKEAYEIYNSPEYKYASQLLLQAYNDLFLFITFATFLILLVIKLDTIDTNSWSWWLVFCPLWISLFLRICQSCYTICCGVNLPEFQEKEDGMVEEDDVESVKDNEDTKKNPFLVEDEESGRKVDLIDQVIEDDSHFNPIASSTKHSDSPVHTGSIENEEKAVEQSKSATETEEKKTSSEEIVNIEEVEEKLEEKVDDEDFFEHFEYQEENESSIVEKSLRAILRILSSIFYLIIACLIAGKISNGADSFSCFWIFTPFLGMIGIGFCCFSLSIFALNEEHLNKMNQHISKTEDDGTPTQAENIIVESIPEEQKPQTYEKFEEGETGGHAHEQELVADSQIDQEVQDAGADNLDELD